MWHRRKTSLVLSKLLCAWILVGSYYYFNRGSARYKQTASPITGEKEIEPSKYADNLYQTDLLTPEVQVPWIKSNSHGASRHLLELVNCTPRAVEQFPWDFLTAEQRKNGFIVFHAIIAVYMFLALALVCDRYFVPSLEVLCELLNMETDVAGATFMAAGSSAPELATSVIGVFIAKDDVGLGTVVGSAIYNVMFVISMCGMFALTDIKLHWWPMVRDCTAYLISVIALILVIYDETVQWFEAVVFLILYALYVLFMYFNERLEVYFVPRCSVWCRRTPNEIQTETTILYNKLPAGATAENGETTHLTEAPTHAHQEAETFHKLCEKPDGIVWCTLWALGFPLSVAMYLTVPDCRRPSCRKFFIVTFIMSLIWLSLFSFLMVWMITVIGFTISIPDSVMSLTFIAFGVSLPDVVASVIVVRDGLGDMAVSNAIGSNVFDILVCLGVPWFLQTCVRAPGAQIQVYSQGLTYSSLMLLSTVVFLLVATHLNGWRLTKKYGLVLLVVYVIYTVMASLYELNIFGYFHPPECPSDY